jgi:Nif-specific regulatory protein
MADAADPERAMLLAVSSALGREIAIEELLDRLVDHIARVLDADRGTLYLLDRARGELFSRAAHLPELAEIRLQMGQGVAGFVAQTGRIVNVPTTMSEARFCDDVDRLTGYHTRSILAAPLRDRAGDVIGVVQLLNKRSGTFSLADADTLARLAEQAAFAIEATTLYEELGRAEDRRAEQIPLSARFNRIVGESASLRAACRLTAKAARTSATVLVVGESGTGKELFARAIHVNSPRQNGPLVKVDCAALPETLIENELFGHERGAFTSADARALGKLDAAAGGTLFLDEIAELPLAVQGKLLRVLQDREFVRVGGTEPVAVDVRVVAATNRDLGRLVNEGRFRGDLYFRVKVVEIALPPLRARGEDDIARLARHFAAAAARRHGRAVPRLSAAALARLQAYRWPGNVRELENCMESALVVMEGGVIEPEHLPLPEGRDRVTPGGASSAPRPSDPRGAPLTPEPLTLEQMERRHVLSVLERAGGNQSVAAKQLGIGRNTLARKLRRWGV